MKPKLIKENLRITTKYKSDKSQPVHHAFFSIQEDESKKWKTLVIRTTENYKKAVAYSIQDGFDNYRPPKDEIACDKNSWPNALLQTLNQGEYSTFLKKELTLCEEDGAYWYALTSDCKNTILKDYDDKISLSRYSFTAPRLKPNTDPGPKFHDDSELNSQHIRNINTL